MNNNNGKRKIGIGRVGVVATHDIFQAALAFELSVWFRYQTYGAPQEFFFLWESTLIFGLVCGLVFWWGGLYRGIWHYASLTDLMAIVRTVTFALLVFLPVLFVITRLQDLPRSSLLFTWPLLIVLLGGPRLLYRLAKDRNLNAVFERDSDARVPVLVVGAGDATDMFIREMTRTRSSGYRVVGIVDDKPGRIGRDIRGIRVFGDIASIPDVVAKLTARGRQPRRLLLASEKLDAHDVRNLLDVATDHGMTLARLPRLTDFQPEADGSPVALHGAGLDIRPVAMEDLLGRPQQVLDRAPMQAMIEGKTVLITGAGGTIGSELVRQVAALKPKSIALFDHSEYALYLIDLEFSESHPELPRRAYLGDVRDQARLDQVFSEARPAIVFHAAAFKHVPLSESNPVETALTNIIGTRNVANASRRANLEAMVLISTDKAVHPTSVMGATKRIAESYCQALDLAETRIANGGTRFLTVRFGNVLGSTGSVVPLFQRQIANGGPVTVTHEDTTRFFMTTREAVQLVLQAASLPPGADGAGKIFVLDMGEPVRIQDLARQMIRLAGLAPGQDIDIVYSGLRPGEKLHEEIFHEGEETEPTALAGILLAGPRAIDLELIDSQLDRLEQVAATRDRAGTLRLVQALVPEYQADEEIAEQIAASD
jgi:O-antigen biosynthesis protein WbqV